ncbi:MAG: RDD family protein [Deferribacteres bacterium]|nr:RDD family protein [Deferribacteres bacterium]
MKPDYPSIARRYLATLIDLLFVLLVMIITAYLFENESDAAATIRIGVVLAMIFIYEPLCTSKFHTLGQGLMGIRVRKGSNHQRISIPAAYARIVIKIFLGIISFVTIPFSRDKKGIHDFVVDSIVIHAPSKQHEETD